MILTCNSCGKRFVVPDSAITASGRMVQCGSCGNKWQQLPIGKDKKTQPSPRSLKVVPRPKTTQQNIQKPRKTKKTAPKKQREISLYSPEYLAKKHGIKINDSQVIKNINKRKKRKFLLDFTTHLLYLFFL